MASKTISIIIAHRLSTIQNSTLILVFQNGCLIKEGHHKTLMTIENGEYKHLFELQGPLIWEDENLSKDMDNATFTKVDNYKSIEADIPQLTE